MSEASDKLVQYVMGCYDSSRQDVYRRYREQVWAKSYKNWRSYLENRIPRKSNLFVPITFQTIEQMVAMEVQSIFNQDGIFTFNPRKYEDIQSASTLSAFADYSVKNQVPDSYQKFTTLLQQAHIYGNGIFKVGWNFDYLEDKETGMLNVLHDHFDFDVVPCRNFYIDPMAKTVQSAKWIITRTYVDDYQLEKMVKMGEIGSLNEEELKQVYTNRTIPSVLENQYYSSMDYSDALRFDKDRKFVEIVEYFSVPEDRLVTVAMKRGTNGIVLRDESLPWKHKQYPFVSFQDISDPESFWGLSTAEIMLPLQSEMNTIRNNRMDRSNFLLNPMFKVKMGELLDQKDLFSSPGKLFRLNDVENLQRFDMGPAYSQEDLNNEQIIKTDIQAVTGINDFTLANQFNATATGTSIVHANAQNRILNKLKFFEETVLKPMGYMFLSLQRQFGDQKQTFYVTGQQYTVRPNDYFKSYDLEVIASYSLQNKQTRLNSILQIAQLIINDPNLNQTELKKELLRSAGLNPNVFFKPEMIPQIPTSQPPPPGQIAQGPNPNSFTQAQPDQGAMGAQGYDFVQGKPV